MKIPLLLASAIAGATALSPSIGTPSAGDQASPTEGASLVGLYACHGARPDGAVYRGLVEIVRHEDTYQLLWTLGPNEHHLGIGVASGATLAVSFFSGMPGVVAYRVQREDGVTRLVGRWSAVDSDGRVFTETLIRIGEASARRHFEVAPPPPQPAPSRGSRSLPFRPA